MIKQENLEVELDMAKSELRDYCVLVTELRAGLQTIYAMRGEDEFIEKICSPLIDKSRQFSSVSI